VSAPRKQRLLIVDDESDLTELLSQILGSEGYEIMTAADGDEAIGILGKESFDAVLLDIMMPHRNGFEVLKYITERHPATKTVMLTGYTDLKSAVEAKQLGAAEFITKPYKLQTVLSTLQRVLGR
jgi:DNA-binding NtrC family response regulator